MNIYQMAEGYARRFLKTEELYYYPFNIESALHILNTQLVYTYFDKIGAVLTYNDIGKKLILMNSNIDNINQRFFIAHEIAHVILGHQGTLFALFYPDKSNALHEKLADICARELLIPGRILRRIAPECNYNVKVLKKIFYVSELEIVIKLRQLGLPYSNTVYKNF